MHLDHLFKPRHVGQSHHLHGGGSDPQKADQRLSQDDEDDAMASYQKYESPKFFVGSGSPVRKQSFQGAEDANSIVDDVDDSSQNRNRNQL